MEILFLNPPKEKEFALFVLDDYNKKARSNQSPLGLLYLKSYLNLIEEDYTVNILDMNALELPIKAVSHAIKEYDPDIIGITCVIGKWETVRELAKEIKIHTNIPVVVGGVNPSLYPWETLQCQDIDYVVAGAGQIPFRNLCFRIETDKDTDHIPNVYTRNNCTEKIKGEFLFGDIDRYPLPDRACLPINHYQMPLFPSQPVTSMVTSLGCPFNCSFCASKNFSPVIIRKTENIIAELKNIEESGIKGVLFNDELFTITPKRIKEICSAIISEDINLDWSVRSRANLISLDSLKLMRDAGCFNIHLGIESGTDRILQKMRKGIDLYTIKKSVDTIKSAGLSVTASFMIGYKSESEDEILETIQFAKDLELNSAQFFITQPEPRTELYEDVKEIYGLPDDIYSEFTLDPASVDLKQNIASTLFSKKELEEYLKYAYSETNNLYKIKEGK